MIRRVNAVLGWEASKEINSRGRGDARKNGALARGLLDLPTPAEAYLRVGTTSS